MARLYYKFGVMGSSKTAAALMCRFNYIQRGMNVLLLKPSIDSRFSKKEVVSRIGISAPCITFTDSENLYDIFEKECENKRIDVVIVDECQFCSKKQIDQLREIAEEIPVLCYGLKTNFKGELFEGSKRLLEVSDSIQEIKSICNCGKKAIMNGRFVNGLLVTQGDEIEIGGDDKYKGLCWSCFKKEQNRTNVHEKILKYLNLFEDKETAGEWSSDTSADNIVMQKPHVIYDEDVQNFINDFKEFRIKSPQNILDIPDNIESLRKVTMKGKDFDFMLCLISYTLNLEKTKPGLLKTLIEDGTITKWLKQIKRCEDIKAKKE